MILPPPIRRPLPTLPPRKALRNRDAERLQRALLAEAYPPSESEGQRAIWFVLIYVCAIGLALGLCTGCSGAPDSTSLVDTDPDLSAPPMPAPMPVPMLAIDPDERAMAFAAEAIDAWAWIADVYVDPSGVPVRVLPDAQMWTPCIVDGEPKSCLPQAKWDGETVMVRETASCPARSLAHEIGHVLGLPHLPAPSVMQVPQPSGCPEWSVGEDVRAALGVGL